MISRRRMMVMFELIGGLLMFPTKCMWWERSKLRYPVPLWYWYENEQGDVWKPTEAHFRGEEGPPPGFEYQHSRSVDLQHYVHSPKWHGGVTSSQGWSEGLALALAHDGYRLRDAIAIASHLCERCMNAAAHDYGLEWGYARYSEQWRKANTRCEYCKGEMA
jgi:hypothetical protein